MRCIQISNGVAEARLGETGKRTGIDRFSLPLRQSRFAHTITVSRFLSRWQSVVPRCAASRSSKVSKMRSVTACLTVASTRHGRKCRFPFLTVLRGFREGAPVRWSSRSRYVPHPAENFRQRCRRAPGRWPSLRPSDSPRSRQYFEQPERYFWMVF